MCYNMYFLSYKNINPLFFYLQQTLERQKSKEVLKTFVERKFTLTWTLFQYRISILDSITEVNHEKLHSLVEILKEKLFENTYY